MPETAELIHEVEPIRLETPIFPPYEIVDSTKKARRHIDRLWKQKLFAVDTEFVKRDLVALQTSDGSDRVCVWADYILDDYLSVLNDRKTKLVFHNFQADYFSMKHFGMQIRRHYADTMVMSWVDHTEQLYFHNLEDCFHREFNIRTPKFEQAFGVVPEGKKKVVKLDIREVQKIQPHRLAAYASLDPYKTIQLFFVYRDRLKKKRARDIFENLWHLYQLQERPFTEVLIRMRERGIRINIDLLKDIQKMVRKDKEELLQKFYRVAGTPEININSPIQLRELLYEQLGFPVIKMTKGGKKAPPAPSTDRETLEVLADQYGKKICQILVDYKALHGHDTKFLTPLQAGAEKEVVCIECERQECVCEDPVGEFEEMFVLRSDFNQIIDTGRISSRKFETIDGDEAGTNLQNIPIRKEKDPHKIRRVFEARSKKKKLVVIDASQIELRVLAHESKAKTMIDAYRNKKDLHSITGKRVFELDHVSWHQIEEEYPEERATGKNINFAIVYDASDWRIGTMMKAPRKQRKEKGRKTLRLWFSEYPEVKVYMKRTERFCENYGYVTTLSGRRRYISLLQTARDEKLRAHAKRQAINSPIQGGAADIIKRVMVEAEFGTLGYCPGAHKRLRELGAVMILQVHDELIYECPAENVDEVAEILNELMVKAYTSLLVPIEAKVASGPNWMAAK